MAFRLPFKKEFWRVKVEKRPPAFVKSKTSKNGIDPGAIAPQRPRLSGRREVSVLPVGSLKHALQDWIFDCEFNLGQSNSDVMSSRNYSGSCKSMSAKYAESMNAGSFRPISPARMMFLADDVVTAKI